MTLGLERRISLVNRTEHSEVSVFEELDTNIRYAVDAWGRQNPSMSAVLSTTFLKKYKDYGWCEHSSTRCAARHTSGNVDFASNRHECPT